MDALSLIVAFAAHPCLVFGVGCQLTILSQVRLYLHRLTGTVSRNAGSLQPSTVQQWATLSECLENYQASSPQGRLYTLTPSVETLLCC